MSKTKKTPRLTEDELRELLVKAEAEIHAVPGDEGFGGWRKRKSGEDWVNS